MRNIVLVDTSVLLNLLNVPGFHQQRDNVYSELERLLDAGTVNLLLPFAAILETGNHIAQLSDGRLRRKFAQGFADQVKQALEGTAPWTPTPAVDLPILALWLEEFPEHAMREVSLGDLTILKEWEAAKERHPRDRVRIWSLDAHLSACDRNPSPRTP